MDHDLTRRSRVVRHRHSNPACTSNLDPANNRRHFRAFRTCLKCLAFLRDGMDRTRVCRQRIFAGPLWSDRTFNPSVANPKNPLISFGSGQHDVAPPLSAYHVLDNYREFKYGLIQGELALREALAREYPEATPDQFVITNGASEAIDLSLRCIAANGGAGGKVLLPRPYYYSYPFNVTFAGLTPIYYDLDQSGKIDFESFARLVPECAAVLINSPSNPTGTVQEIATLRKIEKLW